MKCSLGWFLGFQVSCFPTTLVFWSGKASLKDDTIPLFFRLKNATLKPLWYIQRRPSQVSALSFIQSGCSAARKPVTEALAVYWVVWRVLEWRHQEGRSGPRALAMLWDRAEWGWSCPPWDRAEWGCSCPPWDRAEWGCSCPPWHRALAPKPAHTACALADILGKA